VAFKLVKRKINRSFGGSLTIWLFLAIFATVMLLPLVYAVSTALKPMDEFFIFPPRFFAENPTLDNFKTLFSVFDNADVPLSRYLFNTFFVSILGTAGQVVFSSACAYALAKLHFPFREKMFKIVVLSLMFNSTVTSVSNFLILRSLNMIDTYWATIIPSWASSLGLYLMKQFIEQMIPDTLLEAGRIDGAGEIYMFARIAMPLVKPAWLTLIVFAFQGLWASTSTTFVYSEEIKTINYALSQVQAGGIARSGAAAAGTVITMIVPMLVFILTQSNILETMATSGMKD